MKQIKSWLVGSNQILVSDVTKCPYFCNINDVGKKRHVFSATLKTVLIFCFSWILNQTWVVISYGLKVSIKSPQRPLCLSNLTSKEIRDARRFLFTIIIISQIDTYVDIYYKTRFLNSTIILQSALNVMQHIILAKLINQNRYLYGCSPWTVSINSNILVMTNSDLTFEWG